MGDFCKQTIADLVMSTNGKSDHFQTSRFTIYFGELAPDNMLLQGSTSEDFG